MPDWINENELRVIGMSRSGNHAIIQWIIAQARGRVCFLNCVQGKYNPYYTPRTMADGARWLVNYDRFDLEAEKRGAWSRKDWLIFSHEDDFLGNACSAEYEHYHDGFVGPSARRLDVLILRDPFNLFASRLKSGYGEVSDGLAARIWKQHATAFRRALASGAPRPTPWLRHGPVPINYNRWVSDREYRRQIAGLLGLVFTDAGKQTVPRCAGGSSFDGVHYDGNAADMKVLERWKAYARDPRFLRTLDPSMVALSDSIFGEIAPDLLPRPARAVEGRADRRRTRHASHAISRRSSVPQTAPGVVRHDHAATERRGDIVAAEGAVVSARDDARLRMRDRPRRRG